MPVRSSRGSSCQKTCVVVRSVRSTGVGVDQLSVSPVVHTGPRGEGLLTEPRGPGSWGEVHRCGKRRAGSKTDKNC